MIVYKECSTYISNENQKKDDLDIERPAAPQVTIVVTIVNIGSWLVCGILATVFLVLCCVLLVVKVLNNLGETVFFILKLLLFCGVNY